MTALDDAARLETAVDLACVELAEVGAARFDVIAPDEPRGPYDRPDVGVATMRELDVIIEKVKVHHPTAQLVTVSAPLAPEKVMAIRLPGVKVRGRGKVEL